MDNSIVLAEILGIIFLVVGLEMFFNRKFVSEAVNSVAENAGLLWTWGFMSLIFGAVIIALYNAWVEDWGIIVTICGWAALIKGIWILFFPASAKAAYRSCNKPGLFAFGGVIAFIFGIVLLCVSLGF